MPVSRTVSSPRPSSVAQLDGDAAVEGEFEGVGEQIEDDLLPHVAIDIDRLGRGGAVDARAQARALAQPTEIRRQSAVNAARSVGSKSACMRPASIAREIEQRVDQPQQPQPVAVGDRQPARGARAGSSSARQRLLERPQHQRQRRAEFVADIGEECGLGAIDLGERLGAVALRFIGFGVGDRRGDLAGDQIR